ncbi:hypothetical protein ONA92_17140 [Mycobacteroides salmoniphilum]|uniref:Polyketide cyclase / dehydrase and lipid transport n=1 Tax=Mycobacteroides salmoniphilum TaxID=404941 RepID=A0A4R8STG9_9MYCO|nr:hypothetical protein CCUG62472_02491 [Mycobacteroides salmoniphilum]TEA03740.1 hypothetical protein CCUG60884_02597 [Mycobacteroides salmoniphilum]
MLIEWEFRHERAKVWAAIWDADQWPLGVSGFSPVAGTVFVGGPFPTMGTDYVGTLECAVTELVPVKMIAIDVVAPRISGPASTWEFRSEMFDRDDGGTRAVTTIHGVDPTSRDEKVALGIFTSVASWIYGHASNDLDHPAPRLPGRLSRGAKQRGRLPRPADHGDGENDCEETT